MDVSTRVSFIFSGDSSLAPLKNETTGLIGTTVHSSRDYVYKLVPPTCTVHESGQRSILSCSFELRCRGGTTGVLINCEYPSSAITAPQFIFVSPMSAPLTPINTLEVLGQHPIGITQPKGCNCSTPFLTVYIPCITIFN